MHVMHCTVNTVFNQPLDVSKTPFEGSLTHQNANFVDLEFKGKVCQDVKLLHDDHYLIVLVSHSIVEGGIAKLVLGTWVCLEIQEILHKLAMPFRGRYMQRSTPTTILTVETSPKSVHSNLSS